MNSAVVLSPTGSSHSLLLPHPLATELKCNGGIASMNLAARKFSLRFTHDSSFSCTPKKKGVSLDGSPNKWLCHSSALMSLPLFTADPAFASPASDVPHQNAVLNPAIGETSALLEASVQFLYLGGLLALLGFGSFLVVRQVLVKRELENAAKELQERVRTGQASSEECFELGAVMLRKKLYIQAKSYLGQAINKWDGEEQDLAQVYNALGFTYFSEENMDKAIEQYEKAIQLSPGYVIAWNNLGNAYEKKKEWQKALRAYENTLSYDPSNKVAGERVDGLRQKAERFKGIPSQPNSKR